MGQDPKKYHITDDGVVYRVDDTGEITELGNVGSLDTSKGVSVTPSATLPNDSNIHYSLSEIEQLICDGKGKGLNRFERRFLVKESSNIPVLQIFVEFCGMQWINILITRFERGETFLEPVLHKVAHNKFSSVERLASCKRPYSSPDIYQILHNHDIPQVNDALKANPNSPYYEEGFTPRKKREGCFSVIALFIISTAALIKILI